MFHFVVNIEVEHDCQQIDNSRNIRNLRCLCLSTCCPLNYAQAPAGLIIVKKVIYFYCVNVLEPVQKEDSLRSIF